jgi:hypothetical protein
MSNEWRSFFFSFFVWIRVPSWIIVFPVLPVFSVVHFLTIHQAAERGDGGVELAGVAEELAFQVEQLGVAGTAGSAGSAGGQGLLALAQAWMGLDQESVNLFDNRVGRMGELQALVQKRECFRHIPQFQVRPAQVEEDIGIAGMIRVIEVQQPQIAL